MELARGASLTGIMLNACELFTSFEEEVEYIWMTLDDFTVTKGLYLYSRYFILVVHMYVLGLNRSNLHGQILTIRYRQHFYYAPQYQNLDSTQPSPPGLAIWVLYKFFIWQTLVGVVDYVLCRRVYFMYHRRRGMFIFLCSMMSGKIILVGVTAVFVFRTLSHFSPMGRDTAPMTVAGHYIAGEIIVQTVLVFLAFNRALRTSQGRTRIIHRLADTGTESYLTFIGESPSGFFLLQATLTYVYHP
ncbi:hypothetical protein CVT25_013523 [Psilocybe cyanescens]|uniref:DUF6533 domain-containing protein n=1 Tax=Psilocybe cyanescens TaxID=93625 RepID=A0A409XSY3_PSICY|nr:hypothetical protein CVT25_013523 [Psilocybe cyanescens]